MDQVVVCDRNIHSSMVWGRGRRNRDTQCVATLNAGALVPDAAYGLTAILRYFIRRIKSGSLREASPGKAGISRP